MESRNDVSSSLLVRYAIHRDAVTAEGWKLDIDTCSLFVVYMFHVLRSHPHDIILPMKKRCVYCGNNPTNHALSWFDQTLSIATTEIHRTISRWKLTKMIFRLADKISPLVLKTFVGLGLAKWNHDITKVPNHRGEVLWEEARARNIPIKSVILFGKPIDLHQATVAGKTITFLSLPSGAQKEYDALWWMDDKSTLKKKLEAEGIPVARGGHFSSWEEARARFETLDKPVIVKPRLGSRGRHTTTHIYKEDELKQAFNIGKQLCYYVMMEEHLVGSVYRGTIIDGEVVGILRGDPPRITGDGIHSIRELTDMKNESRDPRIKAVVLSDVHADFLVRMNYTFDTILPAGITIDLLEKIGVSYGGNSAEVTPDTHPKIFEYLSRAAKIVDYPIIGFDFIIEDISRDPDTQKWGIIEANSAAFINLHHDPIEGIPINAAAKVWDMVEKSLAQKK